MSWICECVPNDTPLTTNKNSEWTINSSRLCKLWKLFGAILTFLATAALIYELVQSVFGECIGTGLSVSTDYNETMKFLQFADYEKVSSLI